MRLYCAQSNFDHLKSNELSIGVGYACDITFIRGK